jgi:uncharacterized protein YjiS (DUF1127 family)
MRMSSLLTAFAAYWQATRVRHVATRELAAMSACELGDVGITRLDVSRLFEPRLMQEFRSRGVVGRVWTAATFKPRSQRSVVMTSLGSLA